MSKQHPELDELLLWRSGDLDAPRSHEISAHVDGCAHCARELTAVESLLGDVSAVDRIHASQRFEAAVAARGKQRQQRRRSQWVFFGHTATAAIALALCFAIAITTLTPSARAESWLSKAVAAEGSHTATALALHVRGEDENLNCHVALDAPPKRIRYRNDSTVGGFCESLEIHLQGLGWEWRDLLSAHAFHVWRRDLVSKKDEVQSDGDYRSVTTTTDEGRLRAATIRLRLPDYRVISTRLEFASNEGVQQFDVLGLTLLPSALADRSAEQNPTPSLPSRNVPSQSVPDPLDEIEIRARLALRRGGFDVSALLELQRDGDGLRLLALAPGPAQRASLVSQMEGLANLQVDVVTETEAGRNTRDLPWKGYTGNAPALASTQIRALFHNNPEAREQFINTLDEASLRLVGASRSRDALLELMKRGRAHGHGYRAQVEAAIQELSTNIQADTRKISELLGPLMNTHVATRPTALSYQEATELYTLLHEAVFLSKSSKNSTLQATLDRLHELLTAQ